MKVLVEFNSIEEANIAVAAVQGGASVQPVAQAPATPPYTAPPAAPVAPPAQPPAAAVAPPPLPPAAAAPVAPAAAGGLTKEQVTQAAQAYAKANSPAATKAILQQFGVSAIKDINPEHYAQLYAMFTAA